MTFDAREYKQSVTFTCYLLRLLVTCQLSLYSFFLHFYCERCCYGVLYM